jgi:hypothetical protein
MKADKVALAAKPIEGLSTAHPITPIYLSIYSSSVSKHALAIAARPVGLLRF